MIVKLKQMSSNLKRFSVFVDYNQQQKMYQKFEFQTRYFTDKANILFSYMMNIKVDLI